MLRHFSLTKSGTRRNSVWMLIKEINQEVFCTSNFNENLSIDRAKTHLQKELIIIKMSGSQILNGRGRCVECMKYQLRRKS